MSRLVAVRITLIEGVFLSFTVITSCGFGSPLSNFSINISLLVLNLSVINLNDLY